MQILTLIINALTVLLLLFIFLINKNNRQRKDPKVNYENHINCRLSKTLQQIGGTEMNIEGFNKHIKELKTKKAECLCGKEQHKEGANYCSNCGAKLLTRKEDE